MLLARERLIAEVATMRRLPSMDANVIGEVLLPHEPFRAVVTPVRRLPRVLANMIR